MGQAAMPGCGDRMVGPVPGTGPMAIAGRFPAEVDREGSGTFTGTVTLTADAGPVAGVASPRADVYVTRSGTVVALPMARDLIAVPVLLLPGASQDFDATGSIRACAGDGESASPGMPPILPAGRYEIFAMVAVTDEAGSTTAVTGGPWPLAVT